MRHSLILVSFGLTPGQTGFISLTHLHYINRVLYVYHFWPWSSWVQTDYGLTEWRTCILNDSLLSSSLSSDLPLPAQCLSGPGSTSPSSPSPRSRSSSLPPFPGRIVGFRQYNSFPVPSYDSSKVGLSERKENTSSDTAVPFSLFVILLHFWLFPNASFFLIPFSNDYTSYTLLMVNSDSQADSNFWFEMTSRRSYLWVRILRS